MIRVLLAEMPRMLRELIEDVLASDEEIEIVGSAGSCAELDAAVRNARADVVLLAMPSADQAAAYTRVLYNHPRTTLLGITHDGRGAFLYALRPHKVPIGDVSPGGIVAAIHQAYRLSA